MSKKTTYDILRYGTTTPDKVRSVVDLYWDKEYDGYHKSDWQPALVNGAIESQYCSTHFYMFWVYYDTKHSQLLISFIPEFIDEFPTESYLEDQLISIVLDVTDKDLDDIYTIFGNTFKQLHTTAEFEEYKENFPDNDWEY